MNNDKLSFILKVSSGFVLMFSSGISGRLIVIEDFSLDLFLAFCATSMLFVAALMLNDVSNDLRNSKSK